MGGKIHLLAFVTEVTGAPVSSCNLYEPDRTTGQIGPVTCGSCKRSRLYKAVASGQHTRHAALLNYSQGVQP